MYSGRGHFICDGTIGCVAEKYTYLLGNDCF